MAILLACSCGKQLRVNDEFAGRRVKCPECQNILAVPSNGEGHAVTAAPSSRPGTKANGVVRFTCECGKQMQAKSEHAGKRTKCPGCGASVPIPGGGQETVDFVEKSKLGSRPAPSSKKRLNDDLDRDWEDEEDSPRKGKASAGKGKRSMWPWVAGIAALLLIGGGVTAWFVFFKGGKTSADLALVPRDAMGFFTFRVGEWLQTDAGKEAKNALAQSPDLSKMEKQFGMALTDIERVTFVMPSENPKESWAIVAASKAIDEKKVVAELKSLEKKAGGKTYYVSEGSGYHFVSDKIVIAGEPHTVEQYLERKSEPSKTGPLSDSLQLAEDSKYHMVVGFQVPAALRQKGQAVAAMARAQTGTDLIGPFLEIQSGSVTAILGKDTQIDVRLKFPDDGKAGTAKKTADSLLSIAKLSMPMARNQFLRQAQGVPQANEIFNQVEQALKTLKIEQSGSTVHIPVTVNVNLGKTASDVLIPLLKRGAVTKVREGAGRTQSQNNLKQLTLGMINYAAANGNMLPPSTVGGGLSWRVAILPYIEQEALYRQFKLNEPWNSPHNSKLLAQMPKVFAHPGDPLQNQSSTYYQVFVGQSAPFNGNQRIGYPGGFRDGTSNTFLIVEGGTSVPWTQPIDINYIPNFPLPRLGGVTPDGFNAALADGSVRFIRRTVSDQTIRAAITPAGGEVLRKDW